MRIEISGHARRAELPLRHLARNSPAAVELAGGLGPTIDLTYLVNKPTVLIVSFKEL
jgi:hypothetical protein